MSCEGVQALNPICQALNGGATAVADTAFSHIAGFFGNAAPDPRDKVIAALVEVVGKLLPPGERKELLARLGG